MRVRRCPYFGIYLDVDQKYNSKVLKLKAARSNTKAAAVLFQFSFRLLLSYFWAGLRTAPSVFALLFGASLGSGY